MLKLCNDRALVAPAGISPALWSTKVSFPLMGRASTVLVFNEAALPLAGAGGTRHVGLFGRLVAWDATVVAANRSYVDSSPVKSAGILQTVPVTASSGNGPKRVLRWVSYMVTSFVYGLRAPKPAVVWGSSPPMTAALSALLLAKVRRTGFVLEVRDLWPHILAETGMLADTSMIYRALKALERFLYRQADAIVILAEGSADYIANEGIDRAKMVFVPNGADPEQMVVHEARDVLRSEFGFANFTVVYAGAHGPANGLELVLDAAEELRATDVTFVLVGNGSAKRTLQADADARGLSNVEFLDPIAKADIPRLFAAADAGLHCLADIDLFQHGVSPNKLYDYMAAGLPVITNTQGEVATMVTQAGAGATVAPDQIAAGVRLIAAQSAPERERLGAAGIEWMTTNRSPDAMARRIEEILERVRR